MSSEDNAPTQEGNASPQKGLKEATLEGVRWMSLGRLVAEVVGFGSTVTLAHLIPPAEFGSVAIALILSMLAIGLTNEGFGNPIVQRKTIERAHLQTSFFLCLAFGVSMTLIFLLAVPLVTTPLFGDRTTALVQLASPVFVLVAFRIVPSSLLQRRLAFRRISMIDMCSFVAGTLVSLCLAIAGLDGEAIIGGTLTTSALGSALCFASAPAPFPVLRRAAARDIASFGVPAAFASLVHVGFRNVDYAVLGARVNATQLGIYYRAFTLGVSYPNRMSTIMFRIAFPIYSRTKDSEEMHALRIRFVRLHAVLLYPVLAGAAATAPVLVPWLLGERWEPSVAPLQILAIAGMAAVVFETSAPLMLAHGKVRWLLGYNITGLLLYAPAVYLTAPHGLVAVSIAVVGVHLVLLGITYGVLLNRVVGVPWTHIWDDMAPAVTCSLALVAVALPITDLMSSAGSPDLVTLVTAGILGMAAYLGVLRSLFSAVWTDLITLIRRGVLARKPRSRPSPAAQAQAGTG